MLLPKAIGLVLAIVLLTTVTIILLSTQIEVAKIAAVRAMLMHYNQNRYQMAKRSSHLDLSNKANTSNVTIDIAWHELVLIKSTEKKEIKDDDDAFFASGHEGGNSSIGNLATYLFRILKQLSLAVPIQSLSPLFPHQNEQGSALVSSWSLYPTENPKAQTKATAAAVSSFPKKVPKSRSTHFVKQIAPTVVLSPVSSSSSATASTVSKRSLRLPRQVRQRPKAPAKKPARTTIASKKKTTTRATTTPTTAKTKGKFSISKKPIILTVKARSEPIAAARSTTKKLKVIPKKEEGSGKGGLIGGIVAVIVLLVAVAIFGFFYLRKKKAGAKKAVNAKGEVSVATPTMPVFTLPYTTPLAPDILTAMQFQYKGPLHVYVQQPIDLKHDLENVAVRSPKPEDHIVFDDKLNEVHEIGSEVEIMVDPQGISHVNVTGPQGGGSSDREQQGGQVTDNPNISSSALHSH